MKYLFLSASILLSFSALADTQITCLGKASETRIQVELSGKFWLIDDAVYSFKEKNIPITLYEASIDTNRETQKQHLGLRFTASKRHNGLKKKSKLKFNISQTAVAVTVTDIGRNFELTADYQARLSVEDDPGETLVDTFECQSNNLN